MLRTRQFQFVSFSSRGAAKLKRQSPTTPLCVSVIATLFFFFYSFSFPVIKEAISSRDKPHVLHELALLLQSYKRHVVTAQWNSSSSLLRSFNERPFLVHFYNNNKSPPPFKKKKKKGTTHRVFLLHMFLCVCVCVCDHCGIWRGKKRRRRDVSKRRLEKNGEIVQRKWNKWRL